MLDYTSMLWPQDSPASTRTEKDPREQAPSQTQQGEPLLVSITELALEFLSAGRLVPWLGPALRGLITRELKSRSCVFGSRGRFGIQCHRFCAAPERCSYGRLFEPGQNAPRMAVVAPYFPCPEQAEPGMSISVRIILVGQQAAGDLNCLLETLDTTGRAVGIGPDKVRFCLRERLWKASTSLAPQALVEPRDPQEVYPRVAIGLRSPLILRRKNEVGKRYTVNRPELEDFYSSAAITLQQLFAAHGTELNAPYRHLRQLAEGVRRCEQHYQPFRQVRWSSRSRQRFEMFGCVGGAVFTNVPAALVPWLYWGGLLHVGAHRVAGAGGWRVILD